MSAPAPSPHPDPLPRREQGAASIVRRFVLAAALLVVVVCLVVLVLADTPWGNERVRRVIVAQANGRLTGQLHIGRLRGNLLSDATLTDVRIVDSLRQPVFSARRVRVRYRLWAALHRRVALTSVVLDTPFVVMDKRPGTRWNFQALMRPTATPKDTSAARTPPEIDDVTIHHGLFIYRRPWRPDSTLPADKRDAAITAALGTSARGRTERVAGGFQRILEYHDIDARIPELRFAGHNRAGYARIAALSMIAAPYRPPHVDVRSLVATLYFSRDSLWWRGARLALPASRATGDGRIGFNKSGFSLRLDATPAAFGDLRWLNPKFPAEGGGRFSYTMRVHGDTAEYAVTGADVRYGQATAAGSVALTRLHPAAGVSSTVIRRADFTVARLTTALLRELAPSLKLARRGTIDGHVVMDGAPSALRLNADLQFDDARAGRSRVIARGGLGIGGGIRARDLTVQLRPLQLASLAGTRAHVPLQGRVDGSAVVNGASRDGWHIHGDLTHVDGASRSRVVGDARFQTKDKRLFADAALRPLSLATVGHFVPGAGLRGSVTGHVRAEGTTHDLRLSGVVRSTDGGGRVDGRGSVRLAGPHTRYDVAVALDALDVSAFSRRAPHTRLTGTVATRGRGTTPASADAVMSVHLTRSRVDTFSIDRLIARLAASDGLLRADTIAAVAGGATARASGTLGLVAGREGEMKIALSVDSLAALRPWLGTSDSSRSAAAPGRRTARLVAARADSARRADAVRIEQLALGLPAGVPLVVDTLPAIRRDSLAGSLRVDATVHGNLTRPGVDARADARDIVIRGNTAKSVSAELSSSNARSRDLPLAFRVDAESLQLSGYGFEHARGVGSWWRRALTATVTLRQDSLVSYAATGRLERPTSGAYRIAVDSLTARFDTLVWRLTRPARVAVDHEAVALDSIELRSNQGGRLFGHGIIPRAGDVRLDIAAENVQVATVLRALQRDADAAGRVAAAAHVAGSRSVPQIAGELHLRDARWRGTRLPDADAGVRYAMRTMMVGATMRDSTGKRVLAGEASLPVDLALEHTKSRRWPGPITADITLDTFDLAAVPVTSRAVADVRGRLAGDVHVRGTWVAPRYSGILQLGQGGVLFTNTGMRITDAVAGVRLAGDTVRLDSLVARARGTLRASGTLALAEGKQPFLRLSAEGRNVRVFDATRGLIDADGELTAEGPLDAVHVGGRAEMRHGFLALKQFRKELLRVKAPGDPSFFTIYDTTVPPGVSERRAAALARPHRFGMIADLSLVVDRGNYYRNRPDANTEFYTGRGEELRAHIDTRTSDAWAVGFVRIGEGVAIFRARSFEPERGSLTFSDYTGGPGYLQQVADRPVWEPGRGVLPLQLLTGGTSKGPAVGLQAGTLFPLRGRELNGYLTMGRDRSALLQQSGSSLSGSPSWTGQLSGETGALAHRQQAVTALGVVLHDIGTGATKEFSLDAFSVTPADLPTELVFGKTGGVRGAVLEGGRYVTVDRYVGGQVRLTSAIPGARLAQRLRDAYRVDVVVEPRLLFRRPEDLGITHPTVRTGVFGAFLTRWWDW